MRRTYLNLTEKEIEKIIMMRKRKRSLREIGCEFNVSYVTIKNWLKRFDQDCKINSKQWSSCQAERKDRKSADKFKQNFNPPTETTDMLIRHYYVEDITRYKLTHSQAIEDIYFELGRTKEYILQVLNNSILKR